MGKKTPKDWLRYLIDHGIKMNKEEERDCDWFCQGLG
jgi:hypothetical protein